MAAEPVTPLPEPDSRRDPFFEALVALSADKVDPISEWLYAGGDRGSHENWFTTRYAGRARPPHQNKCICGQPIVKNCYIENILTHELVVIGNCCIRRYLPKNQSSRTCALCSAPHRNRRDAWCGNCRGGTLRCGKHVNESFRAVYESDPEYCRWIAKNADGRISPSLANFASWLKDKLPPDDSKEEEEEEEEVLSVGKHCGKRFEEVYQNHRDYCYWALRTTGGRLAKFKEWCRRRLAAAENSSDTPAGAAAEQPSER